VRKKTEAVRWTNTAQKILRGRPFGEKQAGKLVNTCAPSMPVKPLGDTSNRVMVEKKEKGGRRKARLSVAFNAYQQRGISIVSLKSGQGPCVGGISPRRKKSNEHGIKGVMIRNEQRRRS